MLSYSFPAEGGGDKRPNLPRLSLSCLRSLTQMTANATDKPTIPMPETIALILWVLDQGALLSRKR